MSKSGVLVCSATEAKCHCNHSDGHEGPHVCDCTGSWEIIDGDFHVRSMPNPAWEQDAALKLAQVQDGGD